MVSENFVLAACKYIYQNDNDAVRFVIDDNTIKSLRLYIAANTFDTIMYSYGYKFLHGLYYYFIDIEAYERCQLIIQAIKDHNEYFKDKEKHISLP